MKSFHLDLDRKIVVQHPLCNSVWTITFTSVSTIRRNIAIYLFRLAALICDSNLEVAFVPKEIK